MFLWVVSDDTLVSVRELLSLSPSVKFIAWIHVIRETLLYWSMWKAEQSKLSSEKCSWLQYFEMYSFMHFLFVFCAHLFDAN